MQSTKLITLLKTLDAAEFRRFHQFLQSPYYNYNQQALALYHYLRKYHPDFDSTRLDRTIVFQKLFPDQPFNLKKLRKLMSTLTQLAEEYCLTLELNRDAFQRNRLLSQVYRQRDLPALHQRKLRELIEELEDSTFRNQAYYLELMQLSQELFFSPGTEKTKTGTQLLKQAMEQLDAFYVLGKLKLSAEMKTRENILPEQYDIFLLDECIKLSGRSMVRGNPVYLIYLNVLNLHQDKADTETLFSIVSLFKTILPRIDRQEQQLILHHLLNHTIRLINQGSPQYNRVLYKLYQLGVEQKLLVENGHISEVTFSNIVAAGTKLQAYDWVKRFMDQHSDYIRKEVREETQALCLALWHFNRKEYDQAVQALLHHRFSNKLNLLKSRSLLIRTYFEQFLLDDSYYTFLIDQNHAFEKFIRRHRKIAPDKAEGYLNFIKFIKKILLCKYNQQEAAQLKVELSQLPVITHKGWLLEKVETMV